ncbi:MAG: glutamine-hydrolyzing GMP synthase, partial [Acidobacteriota bacterium]
MPKTSQEALTEHQTVVILDYGSQFTQLIARRLRENRVYCEIHPWSLDIAEIRARVPQAIILSGGPDSVYDRGAPQLDPAVLELGVPVLGICYGMQLIARHLGATVAPADAREYGRATIEVTDPGVLFAGLEPKLTVWASHGDRVEQPPPGFRVTASSDSAPVVAFENANRRIYGIQFHPEVTHTPLGGEMLRNFLYGACQLSGDWRMSSYLDEAVAKIQQQVRERRVLCALSGGVDSSVMAALVKRAVGSRMTAIFVDNGVLRKGEAEQVVHSLRDGLGIPILAVDARDEFLAALTGILDPEAKRRIVGRIFIEVFQRAAQDLEDA